MIPKLERDFKPFRSDIRYHEADQQAPKPCYWCYVDLWMHSCMDMPVRPGCITQIVATQPGWPGGMAESAEEHAQLSRLKMKRAEIGYSIKQHDV